MKKILVVEDDRFLASAYRVKLKKSGYDVEIASNGDDALKALNNGPVNLIILDLVMPVKDGFSTLEDIQKNEDWKKTPIIIASNLGQKEDIEKGMKLGAIDYIVKSDLSMEELVNKIKAIIG